MEKITTTSPKFKIGDRVKILIPNRMKGLIGTITSYNPKMYDVEHYYFLDLDETHIASLGSKLKHHIGRSEREIEKL